MVFSRIYEHLIMSRAFIFLRARLMIKFVLLATSTLENTVEKQRALHRLLLTRISFSGIVLKGNVILRQVNWLTPPKWDNSRKARRHVLFVVPKSLPPIMLRLIAKLRHVASHESVVGGRSRSKAI